MAIIVGFMHVQFDDFDFDSEKRLLLRAGQTIHLSPKAFSLLGALIELHPRAVSKEQLHELLWPNTFVEESSLPGLVGELRMALGDDARRPRYIRTVHRFGYAFCGNVAGTEPRQRAGFVIFKGNEAALYEGENVLGRDPAADICIDDSTVSRRHASIVVTGDGAFVKDLNSKNGTVVDGAKVENGTALTEGQTIVLGDARVMYRTGKRLSSTVTSTDL